MRSKKFVLFLAAAMLLILSACAQIGTLKPAASASEPTSFPATQPPLPSQTPTPINETVTLTSQETETRNDELNLEIYLLQPVLSQPENKAEGFNQVVQALVQNQVESFIGMIAENLDYLTEMADLGGFNSFYLEYIPTHTEQDIISIKFTVSTYVVGAAHPASYSSVLNYDLREEKSLSLDELFLPGSDYLGVLSEQSIQRIRENGYIEWPDGAAPDPVNFQVWNITPEGVLITFDPYQVAPYAAGPQQALVPYAALQSMIDPDGPLGRLIP